MAFWVIAAGFAALYFDVSPVPVFIAATGAVVALSYWMARHPALLRLGMAFAGFTLAHFLLSAIDAEVLAVASDVERTVLEVGGSDEVMIAVASVVMLIAVMVGVCVPPRAKRLRWSSRSADKTEAGGGKAS